MSLASHVRRFAQALVHVSADVCCEMRENSRTVVCVQAILPMVGDMYAKTASLFRQLFLLFIFFYTIPTSLLYIYIISILGKDVMYRRKEGQVVTSTQH